MDTTQSNPLIIDGSIGEGGGQILRTAFSLAILQARPIRITRIRAGRSKPGLMRQHLTCAQAAAAISCGELRGAVLGSTELEFVPHLNRGGVYSFKIGTAGSVALVLQTILPALLRADRNSAITIEGGTHVMNAPSTDFIAHAFLPALARMGARVHMRVERPGFFPNGGGCVVIEIEPTTLQAVSILSRGKPRPIAVHATVAGVPASVAMRENAVIGAHYKLRDDQLHAHDLGPRMGPGNAVSIVAAFEHVDAVVTALGERGVSAERVAERACKTMDHYLESKAPVDEHLSDQLLLPMVLAGGGAFVCQDISSHLRTNVAVIEQFGAAQISLAKQPSETGSHGKTKDGCYLVEVKV